MMSLSQLHYSGHFPFWIKVEKYGMVGHLGLSVIFCPFDCEIRCNEISVKVRVKSIVFLLYYIVNIFISVLSMYKTNNHHFSLFTLFILQNIAEIASK